MRRKKIGILILLICTSLTCLGYFIFMMNQPILEFKDNQKIEIHTTYNTKEFISKIKGYDIEDISIDDSKVNIEKLGIYDIDYTVNKKTYTLKVEVVDTQAPTFDIEDLDIDLGMKVDAQQFVKNVKDQTEVKIYFKDQYDFSKEGKQTVSIIAEDEVGNKTEKNAEINIVKDIEKPTLSGVKDITIFQNENINYLAGVTAKDNCDPKPKIEVDSQDVQLSKIGTYKVKYTVTDRSGNQNIYIKSVNVIAKTTNQPSGQKIVYLTFDDGPSANTAKILDILDKYGAKATFFVTGNGQNYNYLIKKAYNQGHTIGLHTYSHNYAKVYSSVDAYFDDLNKIGQMVKSQIGFVPKYIRFPGGSSNKVSAQYTQGIMTTLTQKVQSAGYQYYDWNASTGDASGNNVAVSRLIKEGTSSSAKNIMILAHDTQAKSTTVEALPKIIEHYQSLGYVFKGIDDQAFTPHHKVNN